MSKTILLNAAFLTVLFQPAHANPVPFRATLTGGGGHGRCTVEVNVDHAAEVEISGDNGLLTTTAGQPAVWRRFQCNAPVPRYPADFRVGKTGGRGTIRLIQDPRNTGGRTVVQIYDPKGGRGNYTFDLQWRGSRGGGWTGSPPPSPGHGPGPWPGPGGFPMAKAIQICRDSVTDRLAQDGYSRVSFESTIPDDQPGRHDWVVGTASAAREWRITWFSFSCSVNFSSGTVRSVDVHRR